MEGEETIKLHPAEALRQVASSVDRGYDELSVILPARTTLTTALHAAQKSLENVDEEMILMPPRTSSRRHIREAALQTVKEWNEGPQYLRGGDGRGLNIRMTANLTTIPSPEPASEKSREKIREVAKQIAKEPFRQPYVILQAQSADRYLPVITANLALQALDGEDKDLKCHLNSVGMFWDTGAPRTIITEEILPVEFREYLKDPIHEPYRLSNGVSVQIDLTIAFTNLVMPITAPAMVIPKESMPNQFVGVLFGQSFCIDRLAYHSIPREILKARGDIIPEDCWGDIIITDHLA